MKQGNSKDVQGEGNYTAARRYGDATKIFVDSGKVKDAAKNAAPKNVQEASDMRQAEAAGKAHAKGIKGSESNMDTTSPAKKASPKNGRVAQKAHTR